MNLVVAIATVGRADVLRKTVDSLSGQGRLPNTVVVVASGPGDVGDLSASPVRPEILFSDAGLCRQRNTALRHLEGHADVVVFLDDDFVMRPDYLAEVEALFDDRTVAGATGRIIADGIGTTGLGFDEAQRLVASDIPPDPMRVRPAEALYGCNMALRMAAIGDLRFDEALPLYGWLEDIDFSYRLARSGALIRSDRLAGVHMGASKGRGSGLRLGYSQVANPIHLLRKRSAPPRLPWQMLIRNLVANLVRSPWPEPHIDRAGRLRGNLLALRHWMTGRIDPRFILQLR